MQANGVNAKLIMDFETKFGQSPEKRNGVRVPFNKSEIKSKQNLIESNTITGRRDATAPARGNIDVAGSIEVPLDVRAIGYFLKGMFGAPSTAGTGPYVHVFKPGPTMPSMVFEQGFTDINTYAVYNGCKISKFAMSLGGDGELTAKVDVIGAKETLASAPYMNAPIDLEVTKFSNFQAAIKEGGSNIAILTKFNLNLDFGLNGDTYAIGGQGFRSAISEGLIKINGSVTAFFENQDLLNKSINGTESSISVTLSNGAHILTIDLPEVIYERNTPGIEGSKGILLNLPYRGYFDNNADNTSIKVSLTNDVASYAV